MSTELLNPINAFLQCPTPAAWICEAKQPRNLPTLLLDHLLCELKAAQSAMFLIRKYAVDRASGDALLAWLRPFEDFVYRNQGNWQALGKCNGLTKAMLPKAGSGYGQALIDKMVLLIKEELHHFYQVLSLIQGRNIPCDAIAAGRYAQGLLAHARTHEPATLVDKLICGAYIEARSCERFAKLAPHLDDQLNKFYVSLLRSEARHYEDYLSLAQTVAHEDISTRVRFFGEVEAELITSPDNDFKFHSGLPT